VSKLKPKLTLEIVRRPDDLHTFQILPRRWVVERTLSWITRHRRTVRDYERLPAAGISLPPDWPGNR
jgi:transposase